MKPIVSVAKCGSYSQKQVEKAIKESLEPFGGMKAFVKTGQNVLIKPNVLGAYAAKENVTTNPAIVEAVVKLVKAAGGKPFIAESCGIGLDVSTEKAFEKSGIAAAAKRQKVDCVALEKKGYNRIGKGKDSFMVSKAFLETDVVITLPKLKTHALTQYTGAIKNSFCIIPYSERRKVHNHRVEAVFCEQLIKIFLSRKPELAIMDGVVAMEGMGPIGGKLKKLGLIISSNDAVALDTVVCNAIGFGEINTLKKAKEKKAGETDLKKIKIIGKIPSISFEKPIGVSSKMPFFIVSIYQQFTMAKPKVIAKKCKKCGICKEHCPASAIEIKNFAEIDSKKCVCCYCCAELCPEKAIVLETGIIGNAMRFMKKQLLERKKPKKNN